MPAALRSILRLAAAALAIVASPAPAESLERIVSREDPKFNCAAAVMTVGRDGDVYLSSEGKGGGYILRVSRDGTRKLGGDAIYSMANATANAEGVIASANSHFNHSVNLYDASFKHFAACGEFLVNDTVQWDAPARVEAGASGDFYGLDQHRLRILRISPAGTIVRVHAFPSEAKAFDFRVCEATQTFYLRSRDGMLRGVGFDGQVKWQQKIPAVFTVNDAGSVYALEGESLKRLSPAGEPQGEIKLPVTAVTAIAVFGDDLVVKRSHAAELFQVYDLATGKLRRVVQSDHERATAEFPILVWTAGETVPFVATAHFRIWATALGDSDWRELKRAGDRLEVPAEFAGLYQLRIAPTLNPQADSEYTLRAVVEVRAPDSQGTVSVWTPLNRIWWGRGEAIPVAAVARTTNTPPEKIALSLRPDAGQGDIAPTLWSETVSAAQGDKPGEWRATLPATFTAQLAPGRYELRAEVAGFTCVAQPIRIGPGLAARGPFRTTRHGDYDGYVSNASVWDFADTADDMLGWARQVGVNQFINRIFAGRYPLAFPNTADGIALQQELEKRLASDPNGVAPQKAAFGFPHAHTLGAWGAYGLREMLILVGMDTGLPIGASMPWAAGMKPEQYAAEIKRYTEPLAALPAFTGWDWVANWWTVDDKRFATTEEKAAYEAALKKANETGIWDPVLDTVGDRAINWQPEAQEIFENALAAVAPGRTTANAGPYRRPEIYPPVTFANVDEVDLHFQAEQISCPDWTAHATDFYKRPGKPAWVHPEIWNDSGTGEQILPASWLAIMRGVDGIGSSGSIPNWGAQPTDSRSGYPGIPTVFRGLTEFSRHYGAWLTTLENNDRVGIVVSHRQIKVDAWGGIGGRSFTRLWEAFMNCLYARQPATFLYPEDKPDLGRFKALLVVGQQYEMEPPLAALLAQAKARGLTIFSDATCREALVKDCTPLGVAFDKVEKLHGFNNDAAWWDFPKALLATAPIVAGKLAAVAAPVAEVDQPEVLVSERRSRDGRFVWVVNNTSSRLDPGRLWRVNNAVATRMPVVANVTLPVKDGEVVYDVFARSEASGRKPAVSVAADLRFAHARLYAVLPRAIRSLDLRVPQALKPGQTFEWTATVPGIEAKLPLRIVLRDGTGRLIEERFTTTGSGSLTVPLNAALPVTVSATELISGKSSGASSPNAEPRTIDAVFGPRLRDLAISPDGTTALVNAFDWGTNLHAIDLDTGKTRWSGRVGDHFAYAPVAAGDGFGVQGYDLATGEGYHFYRLDAAGNVSRRFALPGLPSRLTNWAFAPHLTDRINNFAAGPDGSWIAAAGNLGLAAWAADGKLLWSKDWSQSKRTTMNLVAADGATLIAGQGMKLGAFEARTGKVRWHVTLAATGEIQGLAASADGRAIAARTTAQSGRVFVVREGKVIGSLPTKADAVSLTPDGGHAGVTEGDLLKWYATEGGLQWGFRGDGTLRFPRLSPDGKQLAVSSELGTVYVVDVARGTMTARDMAALASPAWLPDGDLVLASWLGTVCRLSPDGKERWRAVVAPHPPSATAATETVATSRLTTCFNAEATPLPVTPNVVSPTAASVQARMGDKPVSLQHPAAMLFDGETDAQAKPWMSWEDTGMIDSGWRGSFSLEIALVRRVARVTAITFVEDPAHPESWLRDAKLEYWDADSAAWKFSQYLTSDAAVHTHRLNRPIEGMKFRLSRPDAAGWPASNLRLAEIVFHGDDLGPSWPPAVRAKQPVAVLFDENLAELNTAFQNGFNTGYKPVTDADAYSGAAYFLFDPAKNGGGLTQCRPMREIDTWLYPIAERPKAGEYRYLQMAVKRLGPDLKELKMWLGHPDGNPFTVIPLKSTDDWQLVRVDLWPLAKKPLNVTQFWLAFNNGAAAVDQIVLGRTEGDLDALKPGGGTTAESK
ncbi:MAG: WD40 repeat domain-containing protein [Planctomycetia bacterium]